MNSAAQMRVGTVTAVKKPMRLHTRHVALLVVLAAGIVGCGGSEKDSAASDASTTASVATTLPPIIVPETSAPTTLPPVPVYPLTGLPVSDEAAAARPAMVVKIDNNNRARPQSGLNEADIVFEEIVESSTRFAIVLHSQGSDPVGPIRSGRTQDINLLSSLNHPLFVWSGGNNAVTKAIRASDLVELSANSNEVFRAGDFFRNPSHSAPHNLYANTTGLWTLAPIGAGPPEQQFEYLADGATADGEPALGADGNMDGLDITWRYDAASGVYLRTSAEVPHLDAETGQVNTHNVIILTVEYKQSPADPNSPEAQTIGTGQVIVLTGGVVVRGTWTRADLHAPFVITDTSGKPILLTPGRTWIELAKADTFTVVSAG